MVYQIRARLNTREKNIVDDIKDELNLASYSQVISYLCSYYVEQEQLRLSEHRIAEMVAEATTTSVIDALKRNLDSIRVRTGYADKSLKILLDMMNHFILASEMDNEQLYGTSDSPTLLFQQAEKKIQQQIEHYQQNAAFKQKNGDES